jgi:cyclopentanol dehydrogenase
MGRLAGKVAIISGGARGLGAEQVTAFAREGAKILFGDLLDAEGKALEADIRAAGGAAAYEHLDVTREEDWRRIVAAAVGTHGRLDILVNNAGIVIPRVPVEERSVEDWDRVMGVNVKGVFLGTKHAIPAMRRAGGGSIVNIASIAALGQAGIQESSYATSKGAVRVFTRVVASQYAKDKIRCNALFPGPTDTGMLRTFLPDPEALQRRLQRVPLGRLGRPEEIVAGVVFLASDESSFATGTELVIDGGALVE